MATWQQFVDWFHTIAEPAPPPGVSELKILRPRVLLITYNPKNPSDRTQRLSSFQHWADVDDLVDGYIADVRECSNGLVEYQVVQSVDVDFWPVRKDGFSYDWNSFTTCYRTKTGWHKPDEYNGADYDAIMRDFGILQRVEANQIDEVWLFAYPYAGFWESTMGGPGAFYCNSQEILQAPGVSRRFVIMGFNYERGVGEMLEALGHRFESCLAQTWRSQLGNQNLWKRFSRYDKTTPGGANCGMMHWAPNSQKEYEWGNPTKVVSNCDDWLNFPNFQGITRVVDCSDWGSPPNGTGDIRAHHKWWFKHLPKVRGQTLGIANNWWLYGIEPNAVR